MSALDALLRALNARQGLDLSRLDPDALVAGLSAEAVDLLLAEIVADEERAKFNKFADTFPDDGPLRRELYPRHCEFFRAGATFRERCFLAANRVGKTFAGGYEATAHLTGLYPDWWDGRVFRRPTSWWVAGATNETTRDILQKTLLGEVAWRSGQKTLDGSGFVPRDLIGDVTWKQGVQNLVDTVEIRHRTGGTSLLGFKSYDQGRKAFEGTAKNGIWLDEEVDLAVYGEALIRTATTRGILMLTFTPLRGLSEVVLQFLPKEMRPGD